MTPRQELKNVPIRHPQLGFETTIDAGIICEPTYDLIIGIDLMDAVGLVIDQSKSTFMLTTVLQKMLEQCKGEQINTVKWVESEDSDEQPTLNTIGHGKLLNIQQMTSFEEDLEAWKYEPSPEIESLYEEKSECFEQCEEQKCSDALEQWPKTFGF